MGSEDALREAEAEIKNTEPSQGLKNQVPPDEEIQWVAKQDLRTSWFNLILHKIKVVVFMLIFGFVAAIFAMAAMESFLFGFLAFLVVAIGVPGGWVAWQYYHLKHTTIEYAGTDQQFIRYEDSPAKTKSDSLPINRAKDAKFRQDRWDKLLDTGNIYIRGLRGAGSLRIKNVPQAETVHRVAQQQIAEAEQVDDMGGLQQQGVQQGNVRR